MKKALQNKKIRNKSGFSLIEVIISIFLIIVGLFASIELISKGLQESMDSRDQSIAVELAQEGIELVRNVRDTNWLQATSPDDMSFKYLDEEDSNIDKNFVYGELLTTGDYGLTLKNGFYVNDADGTPTKFYRKVLVKKPSSNTVSVVSVVIWNKNGVFPTTPVTTINCNTSNKCAFTQTILTRWGQESFNQ